MQQDTIEFKNQRYQVVGQQFFMYTFAFNDATIAAGGTLEQSITVEKNSFYSWSMLTGKVLNSGKTDVVSNPLLTVQLVNTGTGRQLANVPTLWDACVGDAQLPTLPPDPTLFEPTASLQATLVNVSAATTYGLVHLTLLGMKVFVK